MATTTPLGFQIPDGTDAVSLGDNVIGANGAKAEELHQDARGRLTVIEAKNATQDTDITTARAGAVADAKTYTDGQVATDRGRLGTLEALRAFPMTDVAAGDDFNNFRTRGTYLVRDNSTAAAVVNIPAAGAGILDVDATASGIVFQTYRAYGTSAGLYYRQTSGLSPTPFPWRAWVRIDQPKSLVYTDLTTGADFSAQRTPGKYRVISSTLAASMLNVPGTTKRAGVLTVDAFDSGITFQTYQEYAGTIWYRATSSVGTSPFPYSAWADLAAQPAPAAAVIDNPHAGLTNQLLVEDWSRRRGGRKKTATGAVAFRFDHGLANFDTKIRPLLEARNIPYSLALCSGQWGAAENAGVTASMVNGWVQGGLCEIWNHSRNHAGGVDEATALDEIVTGLTELRTQLPAAQIDGFAIPGTAGRGFAPGFVTGSTVSEFYGSPGGRIILANHAVSTGYIPSTSRRVLDGAVRQGQLHSTLDAATLVSATNEITAAQSGKLGVQFMAHPSLVDTAGYITAATFAQILDYVVVERDAGRLKVCGPYDLLLADAT